MNCSDLFMSQMGRWEDLHLSCSKTCPEQEKPWMPWIWRRLRVKALRWNATWITVRTFTLENVCVLPTGRQVAVDWAVPKDRFLATQSSSSAGRYLDLQKIENDVDIKRLNILIIKTALLVFQETRSRQSKLRNRRTAMTRRKRRNQRHLRRKSPNLKYAAQPQAHVAVN